MENRVSQRKAYGEELVALGGEDTRIVVLEADLGKSTMSNMFQQVYPHRYFEMGIAEQNMLSTAAGLAAIGKIPFCSSFAVFSTGRAYDQIRQTIGIGRLNVKICGSSSGLSDFGDGATHQSVEDIALMGAIPGMTLFTPCDAKQTRLAVREAARIEGPVYIRLTRNNVPDYTSKDNHQVISNLQFLRQGSDVLLFAHGTMVEVALCAADRLESQCVSAGVVNVPIMKPFPYEQLAEVAETVRAVITVEEHSYIGGLATATALALRKSQVPMDYVAIEDRFGQSAYNAEELLNEYGLTADHIMDKTIKLLGQRK